MRLKRRLGLWYIYFFTFIFKLQKLRHTKHIHCSSEKTTNNRQIDIITVAFNNEAFIEYQIKLIQKYAIDPNIHFIVADNSSSSQKRQKIYELCHKNQIAYISLPRTLIAKYPGGSYIHGTVLNWLYYNVIKIRQPYIFGFLDHDLFPIAPFSILEKLKKQDFYGRIREQGNKWWLWAGLCFFKYEKIKHLPLDFIPYMEDNLYLDTGGANYPILYKNYDLQKLVLPIAQNIPISDGNDYHTDYIQTIEDCWLHMINGSNWKGISAKSQQIKNDMIQEKLNRIFET